MKRKPKTCAHCKNQTAVFRIWLPGEVMFLCPQCTNNLEKELIMANHPSNKITNENVHDVVRYHAPTEVQKQKHEILAAAAEAFMQAILSYSPDCADRSTALRKVREAKMWASAAVALEPPETT